MRKKHQYRLAVVASGWHYPLAFYEWVAKQKLPKNWTMDLFCISHRDPSFAVEEKKDKVFEGERAYLDKRLYNKIATVKDILDLGFKYVEEPNTIGDWGNSNQWLEKNDYKKYDLLLFTHDDNLILNDSWFKDMVTDGAYKEWEILANSAGMPKGWLRGSCEFFKPSFIEKIGGSFDLSKVTLKRTGETKATEELGELNDWNNTVIPLMQFVSDNNIQVGYLSPSYRISSYCIEGERGYISNTHGQNTAIEDAGLLFLQQNGII